MTTTETPRGTVKYSFTAGLGDSRDPYNHWDEGGHRHRQGESRKRGVGVVGGHDELAVKDGPVPKCRCKTRRRRRSPFAISKYPRKKGKREA